MSFVFWQIYNDFRPAPFSTESAQFDVCHDVRDVHPKSVVLGPTASIRHHQLTHCEGLFAPDVGGVTEAMFAERELSNIRAADDRRRA
jgi:hypothetical protein